MLMSAKLDYLESDTYRAYKLPWIGRPSQPPDVHSLAVQSKTNEDRVETLVHVSWNGATEVASWRLLHTDHEGEDAEVVAEASRQGFETALSYPGFARFVVIVALGAGGVEIGRSRVVETIRSNALDKSVAAAEEAMWLQGVGGFSNPAGWLLAASIAFVLGIVVCFIAGSIGLWLVRRTKTAAQKGRPGWFDKFPGQRRSRTGDSEDDLQQQEWMLKEHETVLDERPDSAGSRKSSSTVTLRRSSSDD